MNPRTPEASPLPIDNPVHPELASALASCFARLADAGSLSVSRVATVQLAHYPEGAVLPDPDRMASLVVPIAGGVVGTGIVSFPPDEALALIEAWSDRPLAGKDALACYRRGTRALAEAGLRALGFAAGPADALEEDALVGTLVGTHAAADTAVLSAALDVDLDGAAFRGVFVLLAEAKAVQPLQA